MSHYLNTPIVVTRYGEAGYRLWTRAKLNGYNIIVGVDVLMAGRDIFVNSIATAFGIKKPKLILEKLIYPEDPQKINPNDLSVLTGLN